MPAAHGSSDGVEYVQALIDRSPYGRWLGQRVTAATPDGLIIEVAWRDEFVSAPERNALHGGVIAGLLDSAANFAVAERKRELVATLDLRIDFMAVPSVGTLTVEAHVVRPGGRTSVADAALRDADGRLAATARGVFVAAGR
jgi:uncharacterized protein (TIGR00369 family)